MTPESSLAAHRRFLTDRVSVIRKVQGSATVAFQADNVQARVKDYIRPRSDPHDNVQGFQTCIVLVQDLIDKSFPIPMKSGDIVTVQGRTLKILDCDQNTRKVGTTVMAYECLAKGS